MQMRPEPNGGVSSHPHYHLVNPSRLSPIDLKIATKRVLSLPDQACVANVSSSFDNFSVRPGARSISVDDETHLMHGMVSKPYRRGCRMSKQHYCGRKTLCLGQESMVLSRSDNSSQNVPHLSRSRDKCRFGDSRTRTDWLESSSPPLQLFTSSHLISLSMSTHPLVSLWQKYFRRCVVLRGDVFELSPLVSLLWSFTCHFLFAVLPLIILRRGTAIPPAHCLP